MEEEKTQHQTSVTGYLHNVSPIRTSNKTKYFDMQIQTGEDEVKFKIRREVLTLKCNCNSLKICGALRDNYANQRTRI